MAAITAQQATATYDCPVSGCTGTTKLPGALCDFHACLLANGEIPLVRTGGRPRRRRPPQLTDILTRRELEVMSHVADGLANREIATRMQLSEETIKSHVRHILAKLEARSRAHALALCFRRSLIA